MSYILSNIKSSPFLGLDYSNISSDFGYRTFYNDVTKQYDSNFHNGIDMTSGDIVVAVSSGKVVESKNNIEAYSSVYQTGNYVKLYHGKNIYTVYYHMKRGSVKVSVGEIVKKGQILGEKGSTGYSTGPHLHFGVNVNNKWVNPKDYLLGDMIIPEYLEEYSVSDSNKIYVVKRGDTLSGIALLYGLSYKELAEYNNIENPNFIITGQILRIPNTNKKEEIVYIVQSGDNLSKIATLYNTTWQTIYEKNRNIIGDNPNLIHPGQKLII